MGAAAGLLTRGARAEGTTLRCGGRAAAARFCWGASTVMAGSGGCGLVCAAAETETIAAVEASNKLRANTLDIL